MQGDTGASGSISGHCPAVYSFDKDIYPATARSITICTVLVSSGAMDISRITSCHRHSGRRNNLPVTIQYAGDVVNHLLQRQKISYTVKLACETLRFVGNNYDQDIIAGSHFEKLRIYISSCLRVLNRMCSFTSSLTPPGVLPNTINRMEFIFSCCSTSPLFTKSMLSCARVVWAGNS